MTEDTQHLDDLVGEPGEDSTFPSSELVGQVVAIKAQGARHGVTVRTSFGDNDATFAQAIMAEPFGESPYTNCGEVPFFWPVVARKIASATRPWIIGRIVEAEGKRYYTLVSVDDQEAIRAALARHISDPAPIAVKDDVADESPF